MAGFVGGGGDGGGFDYVQDTEPADPSDGESWVDTSDPARPVRVYSADRGEFIPTYETVPLFVTQEAITFSESSVVLGGPVSTGSGQMTMLSGGPSWVDMSNSTDQPYVSGVIINPNEEIDRITGDISSLASGLTRARLIRHSDGTVLASDTSVSGGDTVTLSYNMSPGTDYRFVCDAGGNSWTRPYTLDADPPFSSEPFDVPSTYDDSQANNNVYVWDDVRFEPTSVTATVGYDSTPSDLASWDRLTWQYADRDGSTTFDVETNDGSGWSVHRSDVLPPVSIADVPTGTDVRLVTNLSRPSTSDTSPAVTYVGRRGER